MPRIKKCPFCGERAYFQKEKEKYYMVICSGCDISLPVVPGPNESAKETKERVIRQWNAKA